MNRVVELVRTGAVAIERFDHTPGAPHRDPDRELTTAHGVNFIEAGSFQVRTTGPWVPVATDRLFVTRPGLEFSCAHGEDHPSDRCLSVSYSDDAIEGARSTLTLDEAAVVRALTNRQAYLHLALQDCGGGSEARAEALAGALLHSLSRVVAPHPLFKPDRIAWYASRVDRAKAMIDAHYADKLSLSDLARDAGMSLFHFARVFGELEGRPPHRVLLGVRLAHARARLQEGASVTDTCFAVGFGSLSHFVTTFRRHYGVSPSRISPVR